jgi:thiamine biosynthesis lipoprotein
MTEKRKRTFQLAFLALLIIGTILIIRHQRTMPYQNNTGMIFGTVYHITYQYDENLEKEIRAELMKVDQSLSPFNESSIISQINRNESDVKTNEMFLSVVQLAQQISKETEGAFDITVAPLVNMWGFGFKKEQTPSKETVDSILAITGYEKISITNGKVIKQDPRIMLDCSAIAKGYGCDVVAHFLKKRDIKNFMVEIGGEIVTSGMNSRKEPWHIGVTKPTEDSLNIGNELQTVLNITDKAMATSGNYRNFYYKDGKKYAHTIDPKTGYPVQHNILSATVLANNCATADAYATSFMVLGLEKAQKVLEHHPELMAYFIYTDENDEYAVWYSPALKDKIVE